MGESGLVVEVFREGPCVTCALFWFCVFSVLHMSQALHGAEVVENAGCVVMPGIRL